jgi:hypothetical protein
MQKRRRVKHLLTLEERLTIEAQDLRLRAKKMQTGQEWGARMGSTDQKQSKEEPQPARDLEERRRVIEQYAADLRAFLNKLRRKLD